MIAFSSPFSYLSILSSPTILLQYKNDNQTENDDHTQTHNRRHHPGEGFLCNDWSPFHLSNSQIILFSKAILLVGSRESCHVAFEGSVESSQEGNSQSNHRLVMMVNDNNNDDGE